MRIAVVLIAIGLTGCATKKHVRLQVDPLNQRIGQMEAKSKQTDASLGDLERGVSRVDEQSKSAQAKANQASDEAKQAMDRAVKSGEEAQAANAAAAGAKSLADQGLARTNEVESRMDARFKNMDQFDLVATESVLFAFNQAALSAEARQQLDTAVSRLRDKKHYVLEVQGFTDKVGSSEYNLELSRRRANEVVRYLTITHKIPLHRIYVLGLGSMVPVADDRTTQGRKQNRRVEVRVYSGDDAREGKKVTASVSGGR